MRRAVVAVLVMLLLLPAFAGTGKDEAKDAAEKFGAALVAGQPADFRPLLPTRGKVYLALRKLAHEEEGSYGASQVEAVFRDALAEVAVRSFEVVGLESDAKTFALVHVRAAITDRQKRPCRVSLHLSFQPEGEAWVIREIKESKE